MDLDKPDDITEISVHELYTKLQNDPNLCIIDVREQDEWDNMHLDAAVLIPKDTLKDKIKDVVSDKNKPIYLHCHAGKRSAFAAKELMDAGYTNVYSVKGGIKEWAEEGYPTV